jgi:signal transduction histidine kinase
MVRPAALLASLTNRIFFASAALAVLSIGVAVLVVNAAVTARAEAELARALDEAAAFVEAYRTILFEHFSREARLVADLPRFKAAVDLDDPPTMAPIARDYARQIAADLFLVTSRTGRVLAAVGDAAEPGRDPVAWAALSAAAAGREAVSFWPSPGGLLQVVSVPIWIDPSQPQILGTLSVGFGLHQRAAERFKALTNSEIAFTLGDRVLVSTLPAAANAALAAVGPKLGRHTIRLGREEYVAVCRPLATPGGSVADGGAAPTAVILRSRTEWLRFLRPLHTQLAATALVAVLVATLLSYGIARTVTRPLAAITATMREMSATGDLTRRIPTAQASRWQDEDARLLAATFNALTESIARFQREAAQRERLSSLGRLSTVIAHEIRNPLMIIKAALHRLKRDSLPAADRAATLAAIEDEVARLNRLVGDVLDFARPITFEKAATDLNAVCRSAARAVEADGVAPRVRLDLDPEVPVAFTDAERLRLAIINVLANAREAARQRTADADGAPPGPEVALVTRRAGDRRLVIRVCDNGPGIPTEDLSRIFEPYFTTKRTGSGLGLAITKNIVEGLGGTVTARRRPEGGTEVEIDLPLERVS